MKRMKNSASWCRIVSAILVLTYGSGCSFFGPRMQTITISSEPLGAEISVNGETVGTSPLRTQVHRGEDLLIEARLPGYEAGFRTTHRSLSTVGILDAFGAFLILVPLIGLLSPAAWAHEPTSYAIILDREAVPPGP